MQQSDLEKTLESLYKRQTFGIKPGLGIETRLLERLANPQTNYPVIHIAGTNGKGSTAAMLESALRNVGIKTGLYTSPHLVNFSERIKCNGECINDNELCELIKLIDKSDLEEATFFEFTTAMAFKFFEQKSVQIAIVETGLGGRLDATNVVLPILSIITNISLDHSTYLGNTIAEVAGEKAGIIKNNVPVIIAKMPEEAENTIKRIAKERKSHLIKAEANVSLSISEKTINHIKVNASTQDTNYGKITIPFGADYQVENLATVLTALEYVFNTLNIELPTKPLKEGIEKTKWFGRFQVLEENPIVVIDGAHNVDAANRLVNTLKEFSNEKNIIYIVGMCDDKNNYNFLEQLAGSAKKVLLVELNNPRTATREKLEDICRMLNIKTAKTTFENGLTEAKEMAREDNNIICITGSLFLAQEFLKQ
jgi:dihydrofolate synthase/folylpolyglutamate synthase